jgi:hypothetical protein
MQVLIKGDTDYLAKKLKIVYDKVYTFITPTGYVDITFTQRDNVVPDAIITSHSYKCAVNCSVETYPEFSDLIQKLALS